MIIEVRSLLKTKVITPTGEVVGTTEKVIFSEKSLSIVGILVKRAGLLTPLAHIAFADILDCKNTVTVRDKNSLQSGGKNFQDYLETTGPVLGLPAKTESGRYLGRVTDLDILVESGKINRFYLRNILSERIIPLDYLVTITPKSIIFKDEVNQPLFDRLASEAASLK